MTKRKITIVGGLTALALFIVGFGFEQVKMFGNNTLIDLDKAIEIPAIGNQGNSASSSEVDSLEESGDENSMQMDQEDYKAEKQSVEKTPLTYTVSIRGTTVKLDGREYSQSTIETLLRLGVESNSSIYLVDDYADAKTYKSISDFLQKLHEDVGVSVHE